MVFAKSHSGSFLFPLHTLKKATFRLIEEEFKKGKITNLNKKHRIFEFIHKLRQMGLQREEIFKEACQHNSIHFVEYLIEKPLFQKDVGNYLTGHLLLDTLQIVKESGNLRLETLLRNLYDEIQQNKSHQNMPHSNTFSYADILKKEGSPAVVRGTVTTQQNISEKPQKTYAQALQSGFMQPKQTYAQKLKAKSLPLSR